MQNVALIGKARSGKDTAALWLVRNRHYTRLAFADPLKEMALHVNPIVKIWGTEPDTWVERLTDVVSAVGWERAKDEYPEVRRFLQHMGQGQRDLDPEYWIRLMMPKLDNAEVWNMPVVVTDVRYPNEADALRARGFKLVRLTRPSLTAQTFSLEDNAARHSSETALDGYRADVELVNSGSLNAFYAALSANV